MSSPNRQPKWAAQTVGTSAAYFLLLQTFSLTTIVSLVVIVFGVVGGIAFSKIKVGAGKSFGLMFQRGNFLRIVTVFAVILAVVFITLSDRLTEGAIAVLSGVAGFVLGGLDK